MLVIIGSVLLLVAAIFGLVILIGAFKESVGQGLLCMFVPFYMLYYAFARYRSSKKGLVVGSWAGAAVVGTALVVVGTVMAANEAVADFNADMQQLELDLANPPADLGAGAGAAEESATLMNCNLSEQPGRLCNEYRVTASYTQANATEHCDMVQIVSDDKQPLAQGGCPTDNAIAKCEPRFGNNTTYYYRDPSPDIDNEAAMNSMETLCTGTFTRL